MRTDLIRTTCAYCGVGCGVLAKQRSRRQVEIGGDPEHPANFGRLCSKGSLLGETMGLEGRLLYPELHGKRAPWPDVLDHVASGLQSIIHRHGPDAVALYVSGQMLTEDYYVANKFMKGFLGSANIDTNSRLCMSSSVVAHQRAFGSDTVPVCYEDLESADLLVITGSNFSWCHPVLSQRVREAKARRMIRTVLIDPRKTETAELADIHLALKPATDAILFNGLLTYLRQNDRLDFDFLERHTRGFSEALSAAKPFTIPLVSRLCELDEENIVRFFSLFARTEKTVTLYAQGIHQSTSGTDKINSIINCHLATGRIGRPGMGPFSLTGQGNAMGGREVGGMSTQLAAHIGFDSPTNISIVQEFWRSPTIATRPGLKAVEMFNSIREGAIKALWIIATNPMVSLPDAASVREALTGCELLIISECTRKTDTTAFAHVLLPAAAWGEKDGTVTNSERRISRQRAFLPCPGEAKPDWWILCEVAKRMGFQDAFTFRGPAAIFREHARLSGFRNQGTRDFDISGLEALTDQEYAEMNPVQWPVRSKGSKGTARMFVDGRFFTADAKARLVPILPRPPACLPVARFPFILNTGRIRDQWHTMSRTGDSARLSRHIPEPFAELSSRDAKQLAISEGDIVRISSPLGELLARARIGDTQKPGNVFVPFHWNGQFAKQANVNALVPSSTDPLSGQPEYKQTPVMIRKAEFAFFGFAISRSPLKLSDASYWVRIQATGCTRHEFAYKDPIPDWPTWAKELLGVADRDPTWIEYWDSARKHYRGACLLQSRIESCIYLAAEPALPERAWLESLFSKENLTMTDRSGVLYGQPC